MLRVKNIGDKPAYGQCIKVRKDTVEVMLNGTKIVLPLENVQLAKKKTLKRTYIPKSDSTCVTKRTSRYRKIDVSPIRFQGPHIVFGNYGRMLMDPEIYERAVCVFNDNTGQFLQFGQNPFEQQAAGGGNACARPYQHLGHSIGVPTGPFRSLTETHPVFFDGWLTFTSKDIIDDSMNRIICLFLSRPEKDILYYCVNSSDPPDSRRLGLGIFAGAVGDDVIDYISNELNDLPRRIQMYRVLGQRPSVRLWNPMSTFF
jgi:hypothetical protein